MKQIFGWLLLSFLFLIACLVLWEVVVKVGWILLGVGLGVVAATLFLMLLIIALNLIFE